MALLFVFSAIAFASASFTTSPDNEDLEVNDSPEMSVIAVAKTVIVKQSAKDVFVFGGDVVIEGNVSGDVGVIGGTITQKEGAFIGGDVIVIGGAYKPAGQQPLRTAGKETIVFGILEDELRRSRPQSRNRSFRHRSRLHSLPSVSCRLSFGLWSHSALRRSLRVLLAGQLLGQNWHRPRWLGSASPDSSHRCCLYRPRRPLFPNT